MKIGRESLSKDVEYQGYFVAGFYFSLLDPSQLRSSAALMVLFVLYQLPIILTLSMESICFFFFAIFASICMRTINRKTSIVHLFIVSFFLWQPHSYASASWANEQCAWTYFFFLFTKRIYAHHRKLHWTMQLQHSWIICESFVCEKKKPQSINFLENLLIILQTSFIPRTFSTLQTKNSQWKCNCNRQWMIVAEKF